MTEKTYLTLEPEEKSVIHKAKERDDRFASPTRISDGAWLALLAQEKMDVDDE
jgi:hypothetical protein